MDISQAEFWEKRYQEGSTGWDLGQATPPLVGLLNNHDLPPQGRVMVLGCGRGHDALIWAQSGFEVVAVDFAPSAIAQGKALAQEKGLAVTFLQRNIFDLVPEFTGQFDYVFEHTCFCALPLAQREAYGQLAAQLLKPGGQLLGIFFTHDRPGGPPFGSTPEEIQGIFAPHFQLVLCEWEQQSVPSRQNEEHLMIFSRK